MTLHCSATLLLVREDVAADVDEAGLAAVHGPWVEGIDVIGALQHLADQFRGERVLVILTRAQVACVVRHLGRSAAARGEPGPHRVHLEVGDDGWVALPWVSG